MIQCGKCGSNQFNLKTYPQGNESKISGINIPLIFNITILHFVICLDPHLNE